jgi:hypothetical protein
MTNTFVSRVQDSMPTSKDARQPRQEFDTWNSATVPAWGRIHYLRLPVSVGPQQDGHRTARWADLDEQGL